MTSQQRIKNPYTPTAIEKNVNQTYIIHDDTIKNSTVHKRAADGGRSNPINRGYKNYRSFYWRR